MIIVYHHSCTFPAVPLLFMLENNANSLFRNGVKGSKNLYLYEDMTRCSARWFLVTFIFMHAHLRPLMAEHVLLPGSIEAAPSCQHYYTTMVKFEHQRTNVNTRNKYLNEWDSITSSKEKLSHLFHKNSTFWNIKRDEVRMKFSIYFKCLKIHKIANFDDIILVT